MGADGKDHAGRHHEGFGDPNPQEGEDDGRNDQSLLSRSWKEADVPVGPRGGRLAALQAPVQTGERLLGRSVPPSSPHRPGPRQGCVLGNAMGPPASLTREVPARTGDTKTPRHSCPSAPHTSVPQLQGPLSPRVTSASGCPTFSAPALASLFHSPCPFGSVSGGTSRCC